MSLNHQLADIAKPYLNERINSLKIDSLSPNQLISTNGSNLLVSGGGSVIGDFKHINVTDTSNQITLGTDVTTTINSNTPLSNRIITIPDVSIDSSIVLTQGIQTIDGTKTFVLAPVMTALSASGLVATNGSKALTSSITALTPVFAGLGITGLTASGLIATDGSKNLTSSITALTPVFAGLGITGLTASSLVATDGSKNLTSSVSSLSPTFTGLNLSSLTASKLVATDGSKNLVSVSQVHNTEYLETFSTNVALTSGSFQRLAFATVAVNTFGGDLTISNAGATFTNTSGVDIYLQVSASFTVTSNSTGNFQIQIVRNGATPFGPILVSPGAVASPSVATSSTVVISNNEYVEIFGQIDFDKNINSQLTIKAF